MSVGIDTIDGQHQKLIAQINAVVDIILFQPGPKADLNQVMDELIQYTYEHFAFEEELFAKHGYSETADHLSHHERLRNGLVMHIDKFRRSQLDQAKFLEFLKDWLIKHIMETDMKYSAHLKSKGVI